MLLLTVAILASAAPPSDYRAPRSTSTPNARATARAVVRLIDGQVVKLGPDGATANRRARITILRLADGDHEAKIVEFE